MVNPKDMRLSVLLISRDLSPSVSCTTDAGMHRTGMRTCASCAALLMIRLCPYWPVPFPAGVVGRTEMNSSGWSTQRTCACQFSSSRATFPPPSPAPLTPGCTCAALLMIRLCPYWPVPFPAGVVGRTEMNLEPTSSRELQGRALGSIKALDPVQPSECITFPGQANARTDPLSSPPALSLARLHFHHLGNTPQRLLLS
jgi:hypothetical protein